MNPSSERLVVAAGDVVYAEGDRATCAYLLLRGAVELRQVAREPVLALRRAGEMFGDRALVDDSPRQAMAVAIEECELLAITSSDVSSRMEAVDPLLRICVSAIITRYSETMDPGPGLSPPAVPHLLPIWTAHARAAHDILSFEHQLRAGIARGELDIHFQPIVALATGHLAGFEALIRWRHPERGLLMPADFIPLAEASGVICDITTLCVGKVAQHVAAIHAAAAANPAVADRPFVSVNVSGLDLMQSAFASRTVSTLCDAGVDPADVRLEVTESVLMKDAEKCARTLQNCRDQGLLVAIDDFGTGYSSLNYLNALPISILKMDQSFSRSLLADRAGHKIIAAILHLGRELGLSIIAEGVEKAAQRDVLVAMGCDFGQGYLFGAALDLAGTRALIGTWQARGVPSAECVPISPAA